MSQVRAVYGTVNDLLRISPGFRTGFCILLVLLLLGAMSIFAPYGPTDRRMVPNDRPPSLQYPLGTTSLGQDVFWLTTYAIRNSLFIAGLAVLISRSIAVLLGSFKGYVGGRADRMLSSITDSFIVIPRLPLLILISFLVRGALSMFMLAIVLGLLDWAWPSKRYRAQVLTLREEEFTNTAVFAGMGTFRIYWAGYYQALLARRFWWLGAPIVISILLVVGMYLVSISLGSYLDPRTRLRNLAARSDS